MKNALKTQDGTVAKALLLLDLFAQEGQPMRFRTLLEKSPYPKATTYRLLQVLTKQSMVQYLPENQTYALGNRLVRLAHAAWQQSSLAPIARPILDDLSRKLRLTIHLAQLDNGQVLYVDKRNTNQPLTIFSTTGKIGPAYCTGIGKAMLAFMPENDWDELLALQSYRRFTENTITTSTRLKEELERIRNEGVAFDQEEHEPGIICIAVPICSTRGRVLGGLSVTAQTGNTSLTHLGSLRPILFNAATGIGAAVEDWFFPEVS